MIGASFEEFFLAAEGPIRFALCARFGFEDGRDAAAEAFAYAWEHWERVKEMDNSAGYVYRVGQNAAKRVVRKSARSLLDPTVSDDPNFEPALVPALSQLTVRQRQAVVLIHALGMTYIETASLLGLSPSTIQRHAERGMRKLRSELGIRSNV